MSTAIVSRWKREANGLSYSIAAIAQPTTRHADSSRSHAGASHHAGALLASSDNYYAGDPLLHYRFEQAGEYVLVVRDVRYQGNADWTYSVVVHARPFVTQANPLVVSSQSPQPGSCVGFAIPPLAQVAGNPARKPRAYTG